MIKVTDDNGFVLETNDTSYIIGVNPTGQLMHVYYGERITVDSIDELKRKHAFVPGCSSNYDEEHGTYSLCNETLEMSSLGKGDNREPMVEIEYADGSFTSDFVYDNYTIDSSVIPHQGLPGAYSVASNLHLCIKLKDKNSGATLNLHYLVFEKENVIVRSATLENTSEQTLKVRRMLSMMMDMPGTGHKVTSFTGCWTNEMNKTAQVLNAGKLVLESRLGSSSNTCNPFFMVSHENTTEDFGPAYAFNLVYSGNHYEAIEVSPYNMTRIATGINPTGFTFTLKPGENFDAPEAVMTYSSNKGFNGVSENMHPFVRTHIVRGKYQFADRPILLNSWEANYFDITEKKLVRLAKEAGRVGMELLVMDDGWFSRRDNDKSSLGDWEVNTKKLPGGLKRLSEKVNKCGVNLGIWIEPEMVSEDSRLYEEHPEWAMKIPEKDHSMGRHQMLLDLCNPLVVDYMIAAISDVLSQGNISYVKWDYNRNFTDVYSLYLDADRQGETMHRYILGFYRMLRTLTERFPDILFEGCASGGNRFDLGMLSYFPQIWASDNSDAISRLDIQQGYSYGYPQSCFTSHVSDCPNHQTLRNGPLETRYAVAAAGVLGYELNLTECTRAEKRAIKAQVADYKENRQTLQYGQYYRTGEGNVVKWNVVSSDKTKSIATIVQRQVKAAKEDETLIVKGLDERTLYNVKMSRFKINLKHFGSLVNTVAPIHIKKDGILHKLISLFVKMDSEEIDVKMYGDALGTAGYPMAQAYVGTGYDGNTRYMNDGDCRVVEISS